MKKFITLSMALTMALCSLSYGAVINPKQDGNIVKSYTKTDDTNAQCDIITAYLNSEDVAEKLTKELTENTKKTDKDVSYEVEGGNIYFNKTTGLITSADNTVTKVDIPLYIDKVLVVGIDDYAFFNCRNLKEVSMKTEPKTIGKKAFAYSGLKKITLSQKITTIGESAFAYCPITDNINSIGSNAFEQSALTTITMPKALTEVPENCFNGCSALKTIGLNTGVKTVGKNAFKGCSSLLNITIPANV